VGVSASGVIGVVGISGVDGVSRLPDGDGDIGGAAPRPGVGGTVGDGGRKKVVTNVYSAETLSRSTSRSERNKASGVDF
jgi:hypothetical protein